jgi:hypothetical protein
MSHLSWAFPSDFETIVNENDVKKNYMHNPNDEWQDEYFFNDAGENKVQYHNC